MRKARDRECSDKGKAPHGAAALKTTLAVVLAAGMCPAVPAVAAENDAQPAASAAASAAADQSGAGASADVAASTSTATPLDAALAADSSSDSSYIVDWTTSGTCEWSIDADGNLVVRPADDATEGTMGTFLISPWYAYRTSIKTAKFSGSVTASPAMLFQGCTALTSVDLTGLVLSDSSSMNRMFSGCTALTSVDLSVVDTSSVTNMSYLFSDCSSLTSVKLTGNDTSKVTQMRSMFSGCSALKSVDLSPLTTSSVTDMQSMFYGCSALASLDLHGFDTSNVTQMSNMFYGCSSLASLELASFDTSKVTSSDSQSGLQLSGMSDMFEGCSSLVAVSLGAKFSFSGSGETRQCSLPTPSGSGYSGKWMSSSDGKTYAASEIPNNVADTYFAEESTKTESDYIVDWTTNGTCEWSIDSKGNMVVRPLNGAASGELASGLWIGDGLDYTTKVTSVRIEGKVKCAADGIGFTGATALTSVNLTGLDTSAVTNMARMFANCTALTSLDLSMLDTSAVTTMTSMFINCSSLTSLNISSFDTSKTQTMLTMFTGCSKLASVSLGAKFSFCGSMPVRQCMLPTPTGDNVTGKWLSSADGTAYDPAEVPNNVAATYTAQTASSDSDGTDSGDSTDNTTTYNLVNGKVTITDETPYIYMGRAITPAVSVTYGDTTLTEGTDYTVTYANNEGFGIGALEVSGTGSYTGKVLRTFTITSAVVDVFDDAKYADWYVKSGALDYAYAHKLIMGYDDSSTFGAYDYIKRQDVAVILWRMAGEPEVDGGTAFEDVDYSQYYGPAVRWARETGVISGYQDEDGRYRNFGPGDLVTREQLAVMIANYAGKVGGLDIASDCAKLDALPDAADVSDWARTSMGWCMDEGILNGVNESGTAYAQPAGNAWRSSMASMAAALHRDVLKLG